MHPRASNLSQRLVRAGRRAGLTLVEIVVVIAIMTISMAMYAQTLTASARLDPVANETMLAAEGARLVLERMKAEDFEDVFALYNADPTDDPGGPGTAPGNTFSVEGLAPATTGAIVGRIDFPVVDGTLRETATDETLVMPRDLNGDGVIDAASRANDYLLLPVRVRIEWASATGRRGRRSLDTYAMFSPL
ncbi:MAG: type II secretion system protein [Planctomycetes bacterium]|nr:type II secretion system protein [Planctomycetota bacterium]